MPLPKHALMHARTDGRTNRKHNAPGASTGWAGGIKIMMMTMIRNTANNTRRKGRLHY